MNEARLAEMLSADSASRMGFEGQKCSVLPEFLALCAEAILVYLHVPVFRIGQRCPGPLPTTCPCKDLPQGGKHITQAGGIKRTLPGIGRSDDPLDESGGFSCSCAIVTASVDSPLSTAAIDSSN